MGKGQFLGEFEQLLLLALLRLEDEAYGMTIRQEIQDRTDRTVAIGQVYAALERLEQKGFLSSSVGDSQPVRGGRARRTFRLTADGAEALTRSRDMMDRMAEGLDLESLETA